MNNIVRNIIKYAIALLVGAGLLFLYMWLNEFSQVTDTAEKYRMLTDAFSIPGIILIMVGGLVFASTDGFFDMITFGLSKAKSMLIPFSKKSNETFYDYKERKSKNRLSGYSFLFFTGIAYLTVGIIFLILFYKAYN